MDSYPVCDKVINTDAAFRPFFSDHHFYHGIVFLNIYNCTWTWSIFYQYVTWKYFLESMAALVVPSTAGPRVGKVLALSVHFEWNLKLWSNIVRHAPFVTMSHLFFSSLNCFSIMLSPSGFILRAYLDYLHDRDYLTKDIPVFKNFVFFKHLNIRRPIGWMGSTAGTTLVTLIKHAWKQRAYLGYSHYCFWGFTLLLLKLRIF